MKSLEEILRILREHKGELAQRYGVQELAIFGSYARGEQTPVSDVDILVTLGKPLGLRFFELWDHLENLLGLQVDLLTPNAVRQKPLLWESAKRELVYV